MPKDEQLERAKEVWLSLSREKTLVSLPKVPDSFAADIFDASDGILQQAYSEAYHATLKHMRRPSGELGGIDAITVMADDMEPKPPRQPRLWSEGIARIRKIQRAARA